MKRIIKILFIIILSAVILVLLSAGAVAIYVNKNIDFEKDEALFVAAKDEKFIRFYYDKKGKDDIEKYEPVLFEEINLSSINREWYSLDEFSPYLKYGFIAMEDRDFFSHHGVDIKRTLAATANYIFNREKSFGGSTITQQVIKNVSGDNEKTLKRKLDEIIRAYHVESAHSKEEILELYLNIIPMSNSIVGIGLASESFFGKEPSKLTAAEAATLIGIANAPSRYNPYKNGKACLEKRNRVLYAMYQEGVIDKNEYEKAKREKLRLEEKKQTNGKVKSWFAETVISDVITDLMLTNNSSYEAARVMLYKNGADIYTTVDPDIQSILESYFRNPANFPKECSDGLEYAMVICDSEKNLLRGIVGAVGEKRLNGAVNNATSLHTPGSVLKPLALYLPLIDARKITASTVFDDVPVTFSKSDSGEYVEYPKNYPNRYDGLTTVAEALRISKNTVAVRLYNMLGAEKIYQYLKNNFGFESLVYSEKVNSKRLTDLAPSPLALGQLTRGVSLKKLTEAYTVFPAEGKMNTARSYIAVLNNRGEVILKKENKEQKISDSASARAMTQLLSAVVDSGTASKISLKNIYDTAGKTGTSGNDRDRIFVGYTPYYTAGIWCGYTNKSAAVENHEKNHLTVWDSIMKLVHEKKIGYDNEKNFSTKGLTYAPYCMDSGKLFSLECSYDPRGERIAYGYFIKGTEPSEVCDTHILLYENLFPFLRKISLIQTGERNFPKEIAVVDEKYVYRRRSKNNGLSLQT